MAAGVPAHLHPRLDERLHLVAAHHQAAGQRLRGEALQRVGRRLALGLGQVLDRPSSPSTSGRLSSVCGTLMVSKLACGKG
jgi:hypothetical protein